MIKIEDQKTFLQGYKNTSIVLDHALSEANKVWTVEASCAKICELRGYTSDVVYNYLVSQGIVWFGESDFLTKQSVRNPAFGLFNSDGNFVLSNRYAVPIRDICGDTIAIVGWNKEASLKYMTTKTLSFKKELDFFGQEMLSSPQDTTLIVEGIFDALHARAYGFQALSAMGLKLGNKRRALYGLFGSIVGTPDNDKSGRDVIRCDSWGLDSRHGCGYIDWSSVLKPEVLSMVPEGESIKDLDDLLKFIGPESINLILGR